jgi:predicted amidohydrolase YtcJ
VPKLNPALCLFVPVLLCAPLVVCAQTPFADTIFVHGNVLTGKGLEATGASPGAERVSALAVRDGLILAAGTDEAILALKDEHTQVVDLHGAFVMPGFNDAHTHIAEAGQQRLSVDLNGAATLAEMQARIKAYAGKLGPGEWIQGGGWDHTKWPTRTLPTRQDLDAVTGDHPALLMRTDGHIAVVNTAALQSAGITGKTVAPAGGKIDLDASGKPTGIVREAPAIALLRPHIPQPTQAQRKQALQLSFQDALAHGVTSVQDFSDWDDFLAMEAMEKDGDLPVRVSEWLAFDTPLDTLKQMRSHHPLVEGEPDPMLHTAMLKAYMDGSLGSRTAALARPYSDDPANSGLPRFEQTRLDRMSQERAAADFQLGFHAIGDRANSLALDAFTFAHKQRVGSLAARGSSEASIKPASERERFRIEHAQVLLPADFDRFARLHVIASMQPSHLLTDMAWAGDRLGPDRSKYAYAWRSFLDHGVTLAFGTDYPVESISPFRGLYSAVTRMNEAGTQTFQPQETLKITEALYAYTQAPAFAQFEERRKGLLAPGYLADFAVLDRDITKATPQDLLQTHVLRTVVGGVTRYTGGAGTEAPHHNAAPDGVR